MLFGPVPRYSGIGRPRCRGKRLPNPKAGARSARGWAKLQPEGKLCRSRFFLDRARAGTGEILNLYSRRWLIEVSFRDAKQFLGLNDPQNGWSRGKRSKPTPGPRPRGRGGRKAAERTAPFAWAVYGIVVVWYIGENRWKRDVAHRCKRSPWYRSKQTPSFNDMLAAMRVEIMAHRLLARPLRNRTLAETRDTQRSLGIAV